jgi:hypothetical protein
MSPEARERVDRRVRETLLELNLRIFGNASRA